MKWLIVSVLVAAGITGIVFAVKKTPGAATDAAVAKADLPKSSKTGKLKLFDGMGKCLFAKYE